MIQRCTNPKNPKYRIYGERGVSVCERWMSFANFLADMGEPFLRGTLERIDVNGSYEPSNCCWESPRGQANNRRENRIIEHGNTRMTLAEWSHTTGIPYKTLLNRIDHLGWSINDALSKAPSPIGRKYR
jgi:hypothetical protein